MVAFFFWWERRATSPVLDFTLFSNRIYNFSVLAALMQSLGFQYAPYIGAFSGPNDNWMEGWTAFPDFYEQ